MSRIKVCMQKLKNEGRKALIPYVVAGDPTPEFTVPMLHALVASGADILEIGVPFSDPMAEGPVIQLAHERALVHNVGLKDVLAMVSEFRQTDDDTPVVLMGYANPVNHMGYQLFADRAAAAGVDGLLTVDLPPEEAHELNDILKQVSIDSIFLIAPTTTEARIKSIAEMATGYLYYVSLKGVTGAGNLDIDAVRNRVDAIKSITDLPVTVGFGIKDVESAAAVSKLAEGVVVGSALVASIHELAQKLDQKSAIEESVKLIGDMRAGIDQK